MGDRGVGGFRHERAGINVRDYAPGTGSHLGQRQDRPAVAVALLFAREEYGGLGRAGGRSAVGIYCAKQTQFVQSKIDRKYFMGKAL
jgi:hypothetical protein